MPREIKTLSENAAVAKFRQRFVFSYNILSFASAKIHPFNPPQEIFRVMRSVTCRKSAVSKHLGFLKKLKKAKDLLADRAVSSYLLPSFLRKSQRRQAVFGKAFKTVFFPKRQLQRGRTAAEMKSQNARAASNPIRGYHSVCIFRWSPILQLRDLRKFFRRQSHSLFHQA